MTALLASIAATCFGFADFFGGVASRKESAWRVTALTQVTGLPILAAAFLVLPAVMPGAVGRFGWLPIVAGVLAGLSGGIGVLSLFAALATGRMSIVAPITAALAGSLPAIFDLLRGVRIGAPSLVAIALAVGAIVIVSMAPDEAEDAGDTRAALMLALLAGTGFAGSYIAYSFTPETSGLWPLVGSRTTSAVFISVLALMRTGGLAMEWDVRRTAVGAGLLDMTANIALVSAIQRGPLSVASVIASLYPVATVLLAHFVLGERLRPSQRFGIGLAFVAVVLAAIR